MKLSKLHTAVLAIIAANVIWGGASPIFKWSLQNIEPFTLAFLRFLLAALILLPFTMHKLKVKKRDIPMLILLAIVGFNIHISFFLWGLKLASSINAPIIASSAPIFLFLGSWFFLKEHPKRKVLLGTLVSLLGVIIIIARPLLEHGIDTSVMGNIFYLFGTFALVIYTILLKRISHKYPVSVLTFWTFAISSVFFVPLVLWETQSAPFLHDLNIQGYIGIFYGAIFSSLLAYLCYTLAIKHIAANEIGIFMYVDPVVTVLIAIPLLGETITTPFLAGALFVFLGIFISEGRIHYHPLHKFRQKG